MVEPYPTHAATLLENQKRTLADDQSRLTQCLS